MANSPSENTMTISFTLPRALLKAVEKRAKQAMTNKSEFTRRALMNYLSPEERRRVLHELEVGHQSGKYPEHVPDNLVLNQLDVASKDAVNLTKDPTVPSKIMKIADALEGEIMGEAKETPKKKRTKKSA